MTTTDTVDVVPEEIEAKLAEAWTCLSVDDLSDAEQILEPLWQQSQPSDPWHGRLATYYCDLLYRQCRYFEAIRPHQALVTSGNAAIRLRLARCLIRGGEQPVGRMNTDIEVDPDQVIIEAGLSLMVTLAKDTPNQWQSDEAWALEAAHLRSWDHTDAAQAIDQAVETRYWRAHRRRRSSDRQRR